MASLSFRLKKGLKIKDKSKPQPIYLRYKNGRSIDYNASIKETVLLDNWDKEKGEVKNRSAIKNRFEINSLINKLKLHFEKFDSYNRANGIKPSEKQVKEHFQKFFTKPIESLSTNVSEFIEQFIEFPETKRNITSDGTIKSYKQTIGFIKKFEADKYKVDFENLNSDFYNDFVDWAELNGYKPNNIGKHIKNIKAAMRKAVKLKLTNNIDFLDFKVITEKVFSIYLDNEELEKLHNYDLSNYPRHKNARDLFIIGAKTGLRVSDFNHLKPENFEVKHGVKMITKEIKKTREKASIPLHPFINDILENNNGLPPKTMTEQAINDLIKEVAEWAGIDETIRFKEKKGKKSLEVSMPKYKLISSHTARRSFCTNAFYSDMKTHYIMTFSGHKSEKTFLNYIKATPEENAIKLANHPVFNPHLKVAS